MSSKALPYFISRSLHTPVRRYFRAGLEDAALRRPALFYSVTDFSDDPFGPAVLSKILSIHPEAAEEGVPIDPLIVSVEEQFAYSFVVQKKYVWLIGPLRFREKIYFAHAFTCAGLGLEEGSLSDDFPEQVPVANFTDFVLQTLLVHNMKRNGDESSPFLERHEFLSKNCVNKSVIRDYGQKTTDRMLDNLESGIRHNPYSQEIRERNSIRNGDTEGLRLALRETFAGNYGQLSDDPLRQEIDMGIVTITLATRAAIEGGLHHEEVFSFCDRIIRQMEGARDVATVRHIYRNAEYSLTEMVRDLKEKRSEQPDSKENRHIARCKDYIFGHLHEKITISQIASAIGLDPSYLSSLFSSHEHITLKHYIVNEKIKLAKNMLTYSSYSYIRIATYLGFCSQSHLGQEFKKSTGMSLKEYRDAYAREEFADF